MTFCMIKTFLPVSRFFCMKAGTVMSTRLQKVGVLGQLLPTSVEKISSCRLIANSSTKSDEFSGSSIQAFMCFKYLRLIKAAVREYGPITEENSRLSALLESAHRHNLPQDFIEFALKISVDVRAKVGLYEIFHPTGCNFIVQYEDIDQSVTRHHILELCDTYDAILIQGDIKWPEYFEQKGILAVRSDNFVLPNSVMQAEDAASEVGAETVRKEIDAEGITYWKFYCDPCALFEVKRHLSKIANNIEETYVGYVPKTEVSSSSVRNTASQIIVEMNKIPTIDNVYNNVKFSE